MCIYIKKSWMNGDKLLPIIFLEWAYGAGGDGVFFFFCSAWFFLKLILYI